MPDLVISKFPYIISRRIDSQLIRINKLKLELEVMAMELRNLKEIMISINNDQLDLFKE